MHGSIPCEGRVLFFCSVLWSYHHVAISVIRTRETITSERIITLPSVGNIASQRIMCKMLFIMKYNYQQSLRQHYRSLITNSTFYYRKISFKISNLNRDLNLPKSCRRENFLPTFVPFKTTLTYERHQTAI